MPNFFDKLTLFLIKNKDSTEYLDNTEIYNKWAKEDQIKLENITDVKRCLNLIKARDEINKNEETLKSFLGGVNK